MKKFGLFMLCVFLFSGCGNEAMETGENELPLETMTEKEDVQSVKMIKVDGNLYYDTGKDSTLEARCGTMDGGLNPNSVEEFEIPKEDGDANFDAKYGYQSMTGMTKEIPINGNWRIFKKIIDKEMDFDQYKYALKVKGRFPNSVRDSELIVLTNDLNIDFDTVARSMFSSHSKDFLDCYIIPILPEDKWGISLWTENVNKKGLTIVCEQFFGNPAGNLQTGDWFEIEVMNKNNQWEKVGYLPHEYEIAWNSIAYMIKENDRCEFEVDWEHLYGELPRGHYRVGKEFMDFKGAGDFDKDIYYAEFFII